jgi:hypothetical protein
VRYRACVFERLRTPHARTLILIALGSPILAFVLSFALTGFRNLLVLALSPLVGVLLYEATRSPWTKWEIVLVAAIVAVAGLLFLMNPAYLGRML